MNNIMVTGANGFVGSAVLKYLSAQGNHVRGVTRRQVSIDTAAADHLVVDGLEHNTDWSQTLRGMDTVIHTAARVHILKESSKDPVSEFRRVNVDGTVNLARQASQAGVKRFIYLSSIKVNGESTPAGGAFCAQDEPAPVDPYGLSKHESEQALRSLALQTGLEVVIIRPPLVYGPGVKANFLAMMRWLNRGIPLPLGAINNKRSLVALDNLVDLIAVCVNHPAAANQTFLVSDGNDVSITNLLRLQRHLLGKKTLLLPVPMTLLKMGARLVGQLPNFQRLCGSLQVDITSARTLLGWEPPVSLETALKKTIEDFLARNKH